MSATACPGCAIGDVAEVAERGLPTHQLVLPSIHCAACIQTVEGTLGALPGIGRARVNLSQKRVAIEAEPGADPTPWIVALSRAGIEAYESEEQAPDRSEDMILHLGVAGFAMMNVMLLSVAVWSGASESTRDFLHWTAAAIALPATAFSAQPFFRTAWRALKVGRLNMDVPISLAILLACGMSLYEVMEGGAHAWFDAALALTFFLLIGRVLDQRLRRAARSAAADLAALEPRRVLRIEGEDRISRPIAEIGVGDRLWLKAGGRVPVDARPEAAEVSIDRSVLTGESDPVIRRAGEALFAGEILLTGPATLTATAVGEDTKLRRIAALVANAEGARGMFRGLADRAAAIYTPAVHIIAAAAFAGWLLATGDVRMALNVAIATLIITCPCALGLAVPAVAVAATSRLYRDGLLVTSETALERLAGVDTVLFDKTGTLTERRLILPEGLSETDLEIVRALAAASDHPLCRRLAERMAPGPTATLTDIAEVAGQGLCARAGGVEVRLGRGAGDETELVIGARRFALDSEEALLPEARESVEALAALGLEVGMVTGDRASNADRMARDLGLHQVWSEVLPEDKVAIVRDLEAKGRKVLMVGDGLNDTAALAAAHASIAPGSALDASRNAADVILVSGHLPRIAEAIRLARTARRRILQNFGMAAGYNAIAVPIAVLGFATPLAAAIAMSTSSVTVIVNSLRGMRA